MPDLESTKCEERSTLKIKKKNQKQVMPNFAEKKSCLPQVCSFHLSPTCHKKNIALFTEIEFHVFIFCHICVDTLLVF